ncbi:hypothetical protein MMC13_006589 [Lambiella insularis]|nr:hypothetical protein [Lambiella insularis]
MNDGIPILRPLPQRSFQITPVSTEPSTPPSAAAENNESSSLNTSSNTGGAFTPSRTRSILNLTSSTLFGIFSPPDNDGGRDEFNTPLGTGAVTPASPRTPKLQALDARKTPVRPLELHRPRDDSPHHSAGTMRVLISVTFRTTLLFAFGMAYGIIVTHLHDDQRLAPVKVGGIDRYSWSYLLFWGIAGVALGNMLPWVDIVWKDVLGSSQEVGHDNEKAVNGAPLENSSVEAEKSIASAESGLGADWNPVVRSIGAFIGIAFAIRKLPWQSTLQVSLTLALVNPFLWYLIDRSKPGFFLSAIVGVTGTAVLTAVNPDMVPSPATPSPFANTPNSPYNDTPPAGVISHESIGVWTWIASVLFCSSVCFGNIGRRLAWLAR